MKNIVCHGGKSSKMALRVLNLMLFLPVNQSNHMNTATVMDMNTATVMDMNTTTVMKPNPTIAMHLTIIMVAAPTNKL